MTPAQKAEIIKTALSGYPIYDLLPGERNTAAIRKIASTRYAGERGWMDFQGIHDSRKGFVSWDDLLGVIAQGCGEGRRAAYERAYDEWCAWTESNDGPYLSAADRAERLSWLERVTKATSETTAAIIDAGCERYVEPTPLFEIG